MVKIRTSVLGAAGLLGTGSIIVLSILLTLWACEKDGPTDQFRTVSQPLSAVKVRIVFCGDTAFAESYGERQRRLLEEKGYSFPLARVKPIVESADLVISNLETPITNIPQSPLEGKKRYVHWSHPTHAPNAYAAHNMRAFSLANNHVLDFGMDGLVQTIEVLNQNGIDAFGAGRNETEAAAALVKKFKRSGNSFNLAVIGAFQYFRGYGVEFDYFASGQKGGCNPLLVGEIEKQIAELKANVSDVFIVVFPHWGRNYAWKNRRQAFLGRALIRAGADLVIGHGAHGMQEIEQYRGKWILYGLGNFVFLTEGRYERKNYPSYSFAAALIVNQNQGVLEPWLRLYPIFTNNLATGFQPRPLKQAEFDHFSRLLITNSALNAAEARAISAGNDSFGHFLQFRAVTPR